ncbi:hypothetical protein GCM10009557_92160 [Virgisporangium ochraceum]
MVRPLPVLRSRRSRALEGRAIVRTIGTLTTILGGLLLVAAVVLGLKSIPDIQRYLRIRRM